MNVSFGKIRCFKENNPYINNTVANFQRSAMNYAQRAFDPHEKIPFRYGCDEITGLEYSLAEALEKKKNADVYIIAKRNGNVELRVVKKIEGNDGTQKTYIPCESYENKLSVEINPMQPLNRLKDKFRKFARRCEYYLLSGENKINKKKEAEIRASLEVNE